MTTGIHTPEYSYYSSSVDTKQQQDRTQGEKWMLLDKVTPVGLMKATAGEKQCWYSESSCYLVEWIHLTVMHILFYLSNFSIGFHSEFLVAFLFPCISLLCQSTSSFFIQRNIKNSTVLASRCNHTLLNS